MRPARPARIAVAATGLLALSLLCLSLGDHAAPARVLPGYYLPRLLGGGQSSATLFPGSARRHSPARGLRGVALGDLDVAWAGVLCGPGTQKPLVRAAS